MERYSFPGSSRISKGVYDPEKERVRLTFPDGVQWIYERVSPALWKRFKRAGSAGAFLRENLESHPNRRV